MIAEQPHQDRTRAEEIRLCTKSSEVWQICQDCNYSSLADYKPSENHEGYLWLTVPRTELLDNLAQIELLIGSSLNEQHIKDANNPDHPSFFDCTESYQMVIFKGVASSQFDMEIPSLTLNSTSIVCFCFNHVLLTVYDMQDSTVVKVKEFIQRTNRRLLTNHPSDLLYKILHIAVEQIFSLRNPLLIQIALWQNLMLEQTSRFKEWNEFMAFKNTVDQLNVWCEAQEDVIEEWQQYSHQDPEKQFTINLNDLIDHIERCIRYTEKISSNLDTLIQLHYAALSHRNNEVLRVLAVISCIFLPLTLITGIFGMNFANMPILHEPHAYYYTIGIMVSLGIVMLGVFRWRKWV